MVLSNKFCYNLRVENLFRLIWYPIEANKYNLSYLSKSMNGFPINEIVGRKLKDEWNRILAEDQNRK